MNDDVMRLLDLVKEWAICYEVDEQDVAHDLHELIKELYLEYGVRQGKLALPSHVFWVGRAGGPQPSVRNYKLFFEGMIECLELFSDPLSSAEKYAIPAYCESDCSAKDITVNLIYLSRLALAEWALSAGVEPPAYILEGGAARRVRKSERDLSLKENELATISRITNGLFDLVKAIDEFHSEVSVGKLDEVRIRDMRRSLDLIRNPPRSNFDRYSAVLLLAKEANVEMHCDHKTLRKYMRPKPTNKR